MAAPSTSIFHYGDHESQWARLTIPPKPWTILPRGKSAGTTCANGGMPRLPVVVLIHGGDHLQHIHSRVRPMQTKKCIRVCCFSAASIASYCLTKGVGRQSLMNHVISGFWKQKWTIDNTPITGLVPDLNVRGFAVLEVEYRRRDDIGGGTLEPPEPVVRIRGL